jgi:hypothetical protein
LIAASDAALYEAKSRGRGQVAMANGRAGGVVRHNIDRVPVGDPVRPADVPAATDSSLRA